MDAEAALQVLSADETKDHKSALEDLLQIFNSDQPNNELQSVKVKGFRRVLDTLIQYILRERKRFVSSGNKRSEAASASRLSLAASALRLAVEVRINKVWDSTTIATVIDHIVEALPVSEDTLCEPLCLDYLRTLRVVLASGSHCEHLSVTRWTAAFDFCWKLLRAYHVTDSQPDGALGGSFLAIRPTTASIQKNSTSFKNTQSKNKEKTTFTNAHASEVIVSLRQLIAATNAPINERVDLAHDLLCNLLSKARLPPDFLVNTSIALNHLLRWLIVNDVGRTKTCIRRCVPLWRQLWALRSSPLKDEMVKAMLITRNYLNFLIMSQNPSDDLFRTNISLLMESILEELGSRSEKEMLHLEELQFHLLPPAGGILRDLFPPRVSFCTGDERAESRWASVFIVADVLSALENNRLCKAREQSLSRTPKRQKTDSRIAQLSSQIAQGPRSARLISLHLLQFFESSVLLQGDELETLIEVLGKCITDEDSVISSWAMLAMARLANFSSSLETLAVSTWTEVWQLASRKVSSSATCRASSFLQGTLLLRDLVNDQIVSDQVNAMLSSLEINGPNLLCDSSCLLWTLVWRKQAREAPATLKLLNDRLIEWVFTKLSQVDLSDRLGLLQCTSTCRYLDLGRLLFTLLDYTLPEPLDPLPPAAGSFAQALLYQQCQESLVDYLLNVDTPLRTRDPQEIHSRLEKYAEHEQPSIEVSKVVDLCRLEISRLTEAWSALLADKGSSISADVFGYLLTICMLSNDVSCLFELCPSDNAAQLRDKTKSLWIDILKFLSRHATDQAPLQTALETLIGHVSLPGRRSGLDDRFIDCRAPMLKDLANVLETSWMQHDTGAVPANRDAMDLDGEFESQASQTRSASTNEDIPRTALDARHSKQAIRHGFVLTTKVSARAGSPEVQIMEKEVDEFLEYVINLPQSTLLLCQDVLVDLIQSLPLTDEQLNDLLEHIAQELLGNYEWERCELSSRLVIMLLLGSKSRWLDQQAPALHEVATFIYEWLIKAVLKASRPVLSYVNQILLAQLILQLTLAGPGQNAETSSEDVLQNFFIILSKRDLRVKYSLAIQLPEIFSTQVMDSDDSKFQDFIKYLPKDEDWFEGIALRLLTIAEVAAQQPNLLATLCYRIMETAARVPNVIQHAQACFASIAQQRQCSSAKTLFRSVAPRILYDWTANQKLEALPFTTFGYASFAEFADDNSEELFALLMMRSRITESKDLAQSLNVTLAEVIERNFAKPLAYCIGWVTCIERKSNAEVQLKQLFDKARYQKLISEYFCGVLSEIVLSLDREELFAKAIDRRSEQSPSKTLYYTSARSVFVELASRDQENISESKQLPGFSTKYILDMVDRLCRRAGYNPEKVWIPPIVAFVIRRLLNNLDPAAGISRARSILGKIRVVIALSGASVFAEYNVGMLLRALHPLVTTSSLAMDVIPIVTYLLKRGAESLLNQPRFFTGLGILLLLKFNKAFETASTIAKEIFVSSESLTIIGEFQTWLSDFLVGTLGKVDALRERRMSLVHSVSSAISPVSRELNDADDNLLKILLQDRLEGFRLVEKHVSNSIFEILSKHFRSPSKDIPKFLEDNEEATRYSAELFRLCSTAFQNDNILLWTAHTIARTYAATGAFDPNPSALQQPKSGQSRQRQTVADHDTHALLLSSICERLDSDDQSIVGLLEETLRWISIRFTNAKDTDGSAFLERVLKPAIASALVLFDQNPYSEKETVLVESNRTREPVELVIGAPSSKAPPVDSWIKDVTLSLAYQERDDAIIGALPASIARVPGLAAQVFPVLLHVVLDRDIRESKELYKPISASFMNWLSMRDKGIAAHQKLLLDAILYLRTKSFPNESDIAERDAWLALSYSKVAEAAAACNMPAAALLFAELDLPPEVTTHRSRRHSSENQVGPDSELLLKIFNSINDLDSYYGVEQPPTLATILQRAKHEGDGYKTLLYQDAELDSKLRQGKSMSADNFSGFINSLSFMNLDALTYSLMSGQHNTWLTRSSQEKFTETAVRLEQWDVRPSRTPDDPQRAVFDVLHALNTKERIQTVMKQTEQSMLMTLKSLLAESKTGVHSSKALPSLAALGEIYEILQTASSPNIPALLDKFKDRDAWMRLANYDDVRQLATAREVCFSTISKRQVLQENLGITTGDAQLAHIKSLLFSSELARQHGKVNDALSRASHLDSSAPRSRELGLEISPDIDNEIANVLWQQGETSASIKILKNIRLPDKPAGKSLSLTSPILLSNLGEKIASARYESAAELQKTYFLQAVINVNKEPKDAGNVHHTYAAFCDSQLQDADALETLRQVYKLTESRKLEVQELLRAHEEARPGLQKKELERAAARAKSWHDLEYREFKDQQDLRIQMLRRSLRNYLLALHACDNHDTDVLRFVDLWFEYSHYRNPEYETLEEQEVKCTFKTVGDYIGRVPSQKFIVLINQLISRIQAQNSPFQDQLAALVNKICTEHPYHGMNHVFAAQQSSQSPDATAASRLGAITAIANRLAENTTSREYWRRINLANGLYDALADFDASKLQKRTDKVNVSDVPSAAALEAQIPSLRIPLPTMHIPIRSDCDYSHAASVIRFGAKISLESGNSAPKALSARVSDGAEHKVLFKGGSDDLRQDAIMEQVFEQTSELLKHHRETKRRDMHVRTYKVVPLGSNTGVIEFIQNTISLSRFTIAAHARYYPKDISNDEARNKIAKYHGQKLDLRLKVFHEVIAHLHPIGRYFFLERFTDPDEWFARRMAYTRTTAAISILGHVLGLGDRHGMNILLDERTGDVIHIDLGIAFEAGRVLKIPELIPFRLTRDVVDAMGITKTEGVFRRGCEFMLATLRAEQTHLMTLLNVLRYDPLYSWTISPLKAMKMQQQQQQQLALQSSVIVDGDTAAAPLVAVGDANPPAAAAGASEQAEPGNEAKEAARALASVQKKLSSALSPAAAVNELILQATDDKNLARLFCGWAAYL